MFEEKRDNETLWDDRPAEPDEVVSWYVPKSREGQEVVSFYVQSQPLPERARAAEPAGKKKKSRRGLWIFLGCVAGLLVIVVAALAITASHTRRPDDGEELPGGDASSIIHLGDDIHTTIPTVKAQEGLRLEIVDARGPQLTIQEAYARVNPAARGIQDGEDRLPHRGCHLCGSAGALRRSSDRLPDAG